MARQKADNKGKKVDANKSRNVADDLSPNASRRMRHLLGTTNLRYVKPVHINADQPIEIASKTGGMMVINAPLIGSKENESGINMVSSALKLAQASRHDFVLCTGNLVWMLTKRYGVGRAFQTEVSGLKVDPDDVMSQYPESVTKDPSFQSIADRLKKRLPVFISIKTRVDHTIDMLRKAFVAENGRPFYRGPVYVTFGKLEDEIIMFFANEILRLGLFASRTWAQSEIDKNRAVLRRKDVTPAKAKECERKIKDFTEFRDIFLTLSNMADESITEARKLATAYLIKKYEEAIPNSKVISLGNGFIKFENRLIMVTTDKGSNAYRGNLADKLSSATVGHAKGRRDAHTVPNVMLGNDLSPFFEGKLVTYQQSDVEDDKGVCLVLQLPTCISADNFKKVIRDQNISKKDVLTKIASEPGFESGVVALQFVPDFSIPVVSAWGRSCLENRFVFDKPSEIVNIALARRNLLSKMIYIYKEGCNHLGAADVWHCEDKNGLRVYQHQVAKRMCLACRAPIVMHCNDGDITQQANHPYAKNIHPKSMNPEEVRSAIEKIDAKSDMSDVEKYKMARSLLHEQRLYSGTLTIDDQIEGYVQSVNPHIDYFIMVLENAVRTGLEFRGFVTIINHIMGNHNKNSFKDNWIFSSDARHITALLQRDALYHLIKTGNKDMLSLANMVMSGIGHFQNGPLGRARGSVDVVSTKVSGGQRYAVILKHKQGGMKESRNRSNRRSIDHIEFGLPQVNLSGDDHKGGFSITRGNIILKTGCQQGQGSYGEEIDGSDQNVFSAILGLPVGGFAYGPVTFIIFDEDTIRRYAKSPFSIDRKKLFRNEL